MSYSVNNSINGKCNFFTSTTKASQSFSEWIKITIYSFLTFPDIWLSGK